MRSEAKYKSWSGLKKHLESLLCEELQGYITYNYTSYHDVHNAYGRATICYDGKELTSFAFDKMRQQEADVESEYYSGGKWDYSSPKLQEKWNFECTYCEHDFLAAALEFVNMPIESALTSDNYIIRIFAILDRRVGKRTLNKFTEDYICSLPMWLKQFYTLRLSFLSQ